MVEPYISDQWHDAPEGYRFSLTGIDEALWMPLSEAISLLNALPRPTVMPLREFFAWRCSQGLISAKAGRLIQTFGDQSGSIEYRQMPITVEWASPYWAASHGEHWTTNAARIVTSGPASRQINQYLEIAVDREGVDLFRQLILAQNAPQPTHGGGTVPPNRKLNHAEIIGQAASMRAAQPDISKGSAAASIVADLPPNPKSGKPRDTRHIERMIAHLWEGGLSQSPR